MKASFKNLEYRILSLMCCIAYLELSMRLLFAGVEVFTWPDRYKLQLELDHIFNVSAIQLCIAFPSWGLACAREVSCQLCQHNSAGSFLGESEVCQEEGRFHLVLLNLLEQMHCHAIITMSIPQVLLAQLSWHFFPPRFLAEVAVLAKLCDCLQPCSYLSLNFRFTAVRPDFFSKSEFSVQKWIETE